MKIDVNEVLCTQRGAHENATPDFYPRDVRKVPELSNAIYWLWRRVSLMFSFDLTDKLIVSAELIIFLVLFTT